MNFSEAKREFGIRYYLWAISEFEKEIEESFPTMRSFKSGSAWKTYQFMQQLQKSEQLILAHSLLKRFHSAAVKDLDQSCSAYEESLRLRRAEFPSNTLRFDEEIRTRRNSGEKIKFTSKKRLQNVVAAKFKAAFGNECIDLAYDNEDPDLRFKMKCSGWIINTFFYFGRSQTVLSYSHNIESEKTFLYRGGEVGMGMGGMMSFNSYLGIASQTEWHYIMDEDVEATSDIIIKLCGHFFIILPKLLKGLECEKITSE